MKLVYRISIFLLSLYIYSNSCAQSRPTYFRFPGTIDVIPFALTEFDNPNLNSFYLRIFLNDVRNRVGGPALLQAANNPHHPLVLNEVPPRIGQVFVKSLFPLMKSLTLDKDIRGLDFSVLMDVRMAATWLGLHYIVEKVSQRLMDEFGWSSKL